MKDKISQRGGNSKKNSSSASGNSKQIFLTPTALSLKYFNEYDDWICEKKKLSESERWNNR